MRCNPPPFKRSKILETAINSGKPIEGIKGYVPSEIECCSGSTTIYHPVQVTGVRLGDCEFSILVKSTSKDTFVCKTEEEFTMNPKNFFSSLAEVEGYEKHLSLCKQFRVETRPFEYGNGTVTALRRKFKEALEIAPQDLREEIIAEVSDKDEGLNKVSRSFLEEWFTKMMVAKYFPNRYNEEEADDDEDWDD